MSDAEIKAPEAKAPEAEEPAAPVDPAIREMMDAGVFFGRTKAKTHPRAKQFIIANRNGIDVINLEKTQEQLQEAMEFIKEKAAKNTSTILVATQPPLREAVTKIGQEFNMPAVNQRWLGGTLTNYRIISRRVEYFKKLKSDLAANAFAEYTKKEQLDLKKEADKMEEIFSGLTAMAARPDLLIVIDPVLHKTAIAEARRLGIPIVAFANTDTDLDEIDRPVLGNTKAVTSVLWFLEHLVKAMREGKKELEAAKAAVPAKETPDQGAAKQAPAETKQK